ncbi:hypothetical protein MRX96_039272 [Rhipicephalus microplus]
MTRQICRSARTTHAAVRPSPLTTRRLHKGIAVVSLDSLVTEVARLLQTSAKERKGGIEKSGGAPHISLSRMPGKEKSPPSGPKSADSSEGSGQDKIKRSERR